MPDSSALSTASFPVHNLKNPSVRTEGERPCIQFCSAVENKCLTIGVQSMSWGRGSRSTPTRFASLTANTHPPGRQARLKFNGHDGKTTRGFPVIPTSKRMSRAAHANFAAITLRVARSRSSRSDGPGNNQRSGASSITSGCWRTRECGRKPFAKLPSKWRRKCGNGVQGRTRPLARPLPPDLPTARW